MELAERFVAALELVDQGSGEVTGLTPTALALACREVLPVAGVGITMDDPLLRLPLGASDDTTAWVEQLQATLADGPCVDAMAGNRALVADPATMLRCWPAYAPQVFARTPFRSVAAIPLAVPDEAMFGALTLFAVTPDLGDLLDVTEVRREVADLIAGILTGQLAGSAYDGLAGIDWLRSEGLTHRRQVWMAVAVIAGAAQVSDVEALATLRATALRHGLTLDQMADRLVADPATAD